MIFNNVNIIELTEKLKREQRIRIVLFIVCIFLMIASITLIVCYIIINNQYISSINLCENDLCIRSAATLRLAMNTSVDPCDDFYKFACGHWTAEHPDHGWFSPVSAYTMIEETVTAAALKFFQTNASKTEPLSVTQSRNLYASCMNQGAADKLGYTPIYKYLSLLGLPVIPTYMNFTDYKYTKTDTLNWVRIEALSLRLLGIQSFIGFSVEYNATNNSQHYIMIGVPPLINHELPSLLNPQSRQHYKRLRQSKDDENDTNDTDITKQHTKDILYFITYTIIAANYSEYSQLPANFSEIISATTDAIINMREELSELFTLGIPPENCTNSTTECENEIGITVNELQKKTDEVLQQFNLTPIEIWKPYLLQVFDGLNVTLNFKKNETLYTDQYNVLYLVTVVRYLTELPNELIELWYWSKTVFQLIFSTTSYVKQYFEDMSTTTYDLPKNLICAGIVNKYMGMAVSHAIADKIILYETRQRVEDMIFDIKTAFTERLKKIKWMDKKTKSLTLEKCKEMLSLVGYPEWLMEEVALQEYYSNITINNNTYLDNLLSIIQKNIKQDLQKLYAGHDRDWPSDTYPITVNAFHVPWDNSIIVPMAFLFYPLYNLGLEVLNYAATGSTLGHELIHGFDNTGRQYDKYGNNVEWWDKKVIDKFEELTQCFVDQYNSFYVPEVAKYVDGEVSLGENIADNDGLRLAYMAYENFKRRNKEKYKLPGLEQYTNDQMFFIAYASTWCDEIELNNMDYTVDEPHCPKMFRLIGSLQNSEEFAKAFNCPKGSKMNPSVPKCSIW